MILVSWGGHCSFSNNLQHSRDGTANLQRCLSPLNQLLLSFRSLYCRGEWSHCGLSPGLRGSVWVQK